jgi:endoglycosylceramidase
MPRRLGWTLALALVMAAPAVASPTPPLDTTGRWLTDADGRVVLTHGVNMVYKRPPYVPAKTGFGADDAAFLRRHGFNHVRLGTIYTAVEPQPGRYDDAYLDAVAETEKLLARERIFTQIDFHQDLFNERFGGEGFPDWAVFDDGLPAEPLTGFPFTYVSSPGGNRAWDNLWANREGLQDRFAAAWGHVAMRFKGREWLLGYDLINEPWAGSQFPTCANTEGCRAFEEGPLTALQAKATAQIRKHDRESIVWYEPVVTSQFGTKYWTPTPNADPRAAFSFHIYCLVGATQNAESCDALEQLSMDNAQARATENDDPSLLSEFGATTDLRVVERQAARADRAMISWSWWHYCACDDPTTAGPGDVQALVSDPAKPPEGANVFEDKLRALVRPYPQAVAGTPLAFAWDPAAKTFTFAYDVRAAGGARRFPAGAPTEVFVPRLHFPDGYKVEVKGARVASAAGSSLLILRSLEGAGTVELKLTAGKGTFPRVRPAAVRARVTPGRDRRAPYRFRVTGRVMAPEGVEDGCRGSVTVAIKRIGTRRAKLAGNCRFRAVLPRRRSLRGRLRVSVRFGGNDLLLAARAPSLRVRAG